MQKEDLHEMLNQAKKEHAMLLVVADYLTKGNMKNGMLKNAMLESFLIHARNLIDFLYLDEPKWEGDVLAVHYFAEFKQWIDKRGKIPGWLDKTRKKANKLLNHITLSRIKEYKHDRGWQVEKIKERIDQVFNLFEKERDLVLGRNSDYAKNFSG